MIEAVKDYAIFMLSPEGIVSTWNAGAKRLKGYSSQEIIGEHFSKFYPPEDVARGHPQEELAIARETGHYEEEGWRLRKDGSRFWANVVITRVNDEHGNIIGFSKVTRDLTERKQAEEELRRANQELDRRVRARTAELEKALAARDEFVSIASHELKTPLTALRLQAQILLRNIQKRDSPTVSPELLTQFAQQIDQQIDRLTRLVEDMLDISRIQLGKLSTRPEPTDLGQLVRSVADRFYLQLKAARCDLRLALQEPILGNWDPGRIEQVVLNLLSNAVKYGPGKPIVIEAFARVDAAIIRVCDQGIGIAPENQERIFERFERAIAPNQTSGLGLGLYIAREIVRAHGGKITVESALGRGSCFEVELPRSK